MGLYLILIKVAPVPNLITCKSILPQLINESLLIGYMSLFDGPKFRDGHGWLRGQFLFHQLSNEKLIYETVNDMVMQSSESGSCLTCTSPKGSDTPQRGPSIEYMNRSK